MQNSSLRLSMAFLIFIITTIFSGNSIYAQATAPNVQIVSITENAENIEILIQSDKHFIFGDNRYVLYIGEKYFLRNLHPDGDETKIVFFILLNDYQLLHADDEVVLAYGNYNPANAKQTDQQVFHLGKLKK
ncbi:MAG: hypothetical protein IPG60_00300 [Bacteroidetes bacterium]|nr:hypothetical protein [Bacteroidota bacterium]